MFSCEDGVLFFKEGKSGKDGKPRFISYTLEGKVIIGEGCEKSGYYNYESLEDKLKCVIARGLKPVNYDYYPEIGYDEFKDLLLQRGYIISFEMPFKYQSPSKEYLIDEMRLVAFNKKYNMVIVADSFCNKSRFNSIECYCYGLRVAIRRPMMFMGSGTYSVFDLTYVRHVRGYMEAPLHYVERVSYKSTDVKIDPQDAPCGFTYADHPSGVKDFAMYAKKFYDLCSPELRDYLYKG